MLRSNLICSPIALLTLACMGIPSALAQPTFTHWETPHVSPLAMSPDGQMLFAVNTPDNRLEILELGNGMPKRIGSVPVGLDPVSVRARSNSEVWVINHISDSISIVDVAARNVTRTITTGDEPTDVVFANNRAFVTCSQLNEVRVYDLSNLGAAPIIVAIAGQDPRALALSPDGTKLYAAIFESGNATTILSQSLVSSAANPYAGDPNPPPNNGVAFEPPIDPGLPTPPPVSLVVRKNPATNQWNDDNGRNWTPAVTWNVLDHDVAVIDTTTLAVTYIDRLMTLDMQLSVLPDGRLAVVGTEATNQIRFEPNVRSRFVHAMVAIVDPANSANTQVLDLNPHLADAYAQELSSVDAGLRALSVADPRGVVWSADGSAGYVSGMGSNNIAVIDDSGDRLATIDVGAGPTGLVLDEARDRLYVLNKFDASVSVVSTQTNGVLAQTGLYDPTPPAVNAGRPFLYDARATSGLGVTACGACHVDGRMDSLSWDLGDPQGDVKLFNQVCQNVPPNPPSCENWHPMKGPMATQTLQGISATEPLHWRGDREGLPAFAGTFSGLMGGNIPTPGEMVLFEQFVATIKTPPNPNRNIDNSLKTSLAGGNAVTGQNLFMTAPIDAGIVTCNTCHTVPDGTNSQITPAIAIQQTQSQKVPQLRNLFEKVGLDYTSSTNTRGFGFTHDGASDTLFDFLMFPGFTFGANADQKRRDIAAFLLSFSLDTPAGVGVQITLNGTNNGNALVDTMLALANGNSVGLVVKGVQGGVVRGYRYSGASSFQSDRTGEQIAAAALRAAAAAGNELTWTLVPKGSETRIGIDRDLDGHFDRDEIEGCGDPANPAIFPGGISACDTNCDGSVNLFDITGFVDLLSPSPPSGCSSCAGDANSDGSINLFDIQPFVDCLSGP